MFHNRIAHLRSRFEIDALLPTAAGPAVAAQGSSAATMVLVPCAAPVIAWQAQLYRLAYEQAVAQLAPPRHMTHFFSQWN